MRSSRTTSSTSGRALTRIDRPARQGHNPEECISQARQRDVQGIVLPKNPCLKQKIVSILKQEHPLEETDIIELDYSCNSRTFSIGDEWIVKTPLNENSLEKIRREVQILAFLRGRVPFITQARMREGPFPFAIHRKLPGSPLQEDRLLENLSSVQRTRLAEDIAGFLACLHEIGLDEMNFLNLPRWDRFDVLFPSTETAIKSLAKDSLLTSGEREFLIDFCSKYPPQSIPDKVFGHFDLLRKNILFDHSHGMLSGVCDFGDSGIGRRIYEFSNIDFGDSDFVADIVSIYVQKIGIHPSALPLENVRKHSLFERIAFHVNFLNGLERIQKDTLQKLRQEISAYRCANAD